MLSSENKILGRIFIFQLSLKFQFKHACTMQDSLKAMLRVRELVKPRIN